MKTSAHHTRANFQRLSGKFCCKTVLHFTCRASYEIIMLQCGGTLFHSVSHVVCCAREVALPAQSSTETRAVLGVVGTRLLAAVNPAMAAPATTHHLRALCPLMYPLHMCAPTTHSSSHIHSCVRSHTSAPIVFYSRSLSPELSTYSYAHTLVCRGRSAPSCIHCICVLPPHIPAPIFIHVSASTLSIVLIRSRLF